MPKLESIKIIAFWDDDVETSLTGPMDGMEPEEQEDFASNILHNLLAERGLVPMDNTEQSGILKSDEGKK